LGCGAAVVDARAQLAVQAGVDYLDLREDTVPFEVQERGVLLDVGLRWSRTRERVFRWAYSGRLYWGRASYQGAFLDDPSVEASAVSQSSGTLHEGQLRFRASPAIDAAVGLAVDLWRRKLGSNQKEDFRLLWVRLGVEHDPSSERWALGGGLKIPISVDENAHFTDFGFDQNPRLKPGKRLGGFARLSYRIDERRTVAAEWDGYRFGRSGGVTLTIDGGEPAIAFQPAMRMDRIGVKLEHRLGPPPGGAPR
jgi:hypothetical protein